MGAWSELIWLKIGPGACDSSNEPSGSIKRGKFFDCLRTR